MKKLLMAGAISTALGMSGIALAAPVFTVTGGASFLESNQSFNWLTGNIWEGGTLGLTEAANIQVEYIGKEAGFANNVFNWGALSGGTQLFTTGPSSPGTVGQTAAAPFPPVAAEPAKFVTGGPGNLLFNFFVTATGNTVENGHDGTTLPDDIAFWPLPALNGTNGFGNVVYVLLDDGGPIGNSDNDHDDMVLRLTATPIPEPSTWAMLLSGIGLLGFMARRRMQS